MEAFALSNLDPEKLGRRRHGAYYTGLRTAEFMARWAVRHESDVFLEPSFGDGSFLEAVATVTQNRGYRPSRVIGAELREEAAEVAISRGLIERGDAHVGDFLGMAPRCEVDVAIGNPPYVRLRHLEPLSAERAQREAAAALGHSMEPSGSLWMPFVLHAMKFLRRRGRLALVLPHDMTHVKYARPLWGHLGSSFSSIAVIRSRERLFPDILQDVVLLLADGFGGACREVRYVAVSTQESLETGEFEVSERLSLSEIERGKRLFTWAHVPQSVRQVLRDASPLSAQVSDLGKFSIGYVSGHKSFFHPSDEAVERFSLPRELLQPSITSSRGLARSGLFTSEIQVDALERLLQVPNSRNGFLPDGVRRYVEQGEEDGVHRRYKCRVRSPWYAVPGVARPDLVLSVFAEAPVLLLNDARLVASNSLLCGTLAAVEPEVFAASWYTSLTRLSLELEVHSLGGGVLVLIPGEVSRVKLYLASAADDLGSLLTAIDHRLRSGEPEEAYRVGDDTVLRRRAGLSQSQVDEVRASVESLVSWRRR